MREKNQRRKMFCSFVLATTILVNGLPGRAQDVVTSEDFTGASSAFVFKTSRKAAQKKIAFRSTTTVTRTKTARLESAKRITKQSVTVAKVNPKRTKSKEVDPATVKVNSAEFKRKTPQEASVIFAGVGEYYLGQDKLDDAINWFRESVQLDEKNGNAKNGLSDALTRKGDQLLTKENYDIAKLLYNEALTNNPNNAAAYAGLAEIYSAKDDGENAAANYQKALSLDSELTEVNAPLGVIYYQKGDYAQADAALQKAAAANPNNAETQFFIGLLRTKQNRPQEALAAFKRSIELDPNNPEVYYYQGEVYDSLDNDKDAIASYQKAVQLNPKYSEAWFDLGAAFYNRGRYPEAIAAYKEVVKLKPTYGEAHANLADVYRLNNNLDEAIGEYRLATTFIKDDPEIYSKFGYVAARRALTPGYRNFWKVAIDNFEKAVQMSPDNIDYTNLGWAYYNLAQTNLKEKNQTEYQANLGKARDAFVKANSMKPVPKVAAAINLNLGMTLTDLGDYQGSADALKAALGFQKNWIPAMNELGIAYRKKGDFDNAAKQFREVLKLDDKYAPAHYNLAETEFRRGNKKEARKEYEKLKTLDRPDLVTLLELVTNGEILK